MPLTLGLTGMDPATEAALKATFLEANARLGGRWSLVSDAEAEHVVVDMDSMYGPMSWLRLHAAGRQVIGLTTAPRTQTDYRLGRPFDTAHLADLLADIARGAGIELDVQPVEGRAAPVPPVVPAPLPPAATPPMVPPAATVADAAAITGETAAPPRPADDAAVPAAVGTALDAPPAPSHAPDGAPASGHDAAAPAPGVTIAVETAAADATPPADATPSPAIAARAARDTLAAWLEPGALDGRVRHRHASGVVLLIDAGNDSWHGPAALKLLLPCFDGRVERSDFEALDARDWEREAAAAGARQPLSRLRWLGGLLAGGGELLPGTPADTRFQLGKWPQTEREYPRHFRIATQMMKGPATLAEIADASGVPAADVADFINANLATGFVDVAVEPPAAPVEAAKPRGGLLGRLRGTR